jgi:GntR family transcriptional regulator
MTTLQFVGRTAQLVAPRFGPGAGSGMVCYITNTPHPSMHTWSDTLPIYRQLADRLAAQLLDGEPPEGEAMPSVRSLASRYVINPLTVSRALQSLVDEGLVESRRGLGMYVQAGARQRLREAERERFLRHEWPELVARLKRLGLAPEDLTWEDR